ncbi:MAG: ABC transporter ATP-binding protein [Bacillota bacterium]|nr:ABC transporter ATP-binding protein [Bacillota bacterium]
MKLHINNLNKDYGKVKALKGFSATLTQGIYGLLGPNGAGKSTLMNIIADNLKADKGSITLNDEDIISMGHRYREILGYMPQQQGLYDSFTGYKFLGYMAALKGMDKKYASQRIDEVLELVNLKDDARKKLGSFSGGMRQRILIAQAILNDPKILILDEPTAGLDPKERIRMRNQISEISFNKIVIIATHVVSDIEYIAKEILLLKDGELTAKGKPEVLLQSIKDKVFEIQVLPQEVQGVNREYRISSIHKEDDMVRARIISDTLPNKFSFKQVRPTLEDLYLYTFDERGYSYENLSI